MEQLVLFRTLSAKLSSEEYQTFIQKSLRQNENNQQIFSSILFQYFHQKLIQPQKSQAHQDELNVNDMNKLISDIIQNRKLIINEIHENENENNSDDGQAIFTFDKLPATSHQKIASFLPLLSYSNLECCNRSIFVSLRSTPSLYEIDTENDNHRKFMNFLANYDQQDINIKSSINKISKIKKLAINIIENEQINTLAKKQFIVLLKLINRYNLTYLSLPPIEGSGLDSLVGSDRFNWQMLKHLSVWYSYENSVSSICQILEHCVNLSFLEFMIAESDLELDFDEKVVNKLMQFEHLQNVKGLSLWGAGTMTPIFKMLSSKLESLHIDLNGGYDVMWSNCDIEFNKLKELHLSYVSSDQVISILQKTPHLERLCVDEHNEDIEADCVRTMIQLPKLNYLCLDTHSIFVPVNELNEALQDALLTTIANKERFELHLVCLDTIRTILDQDEVCVQLMRLVNSMNIWSQVFLLRCEFRSSNLYKFTKADQLQKLLDNISAKFYVNSMIDQTNQTIIVKNKMSEYVSTQKWIMRCDWCKEYVR